MCRALSLLFVFIFLYAAIPQVSFALLPPDLIFSVGSQVVQIFALVALVIGGTISSLLIGFRQFFALSKRHVWWIIGCVILVLVISVAGVYVHTLKVQNQTYREEMTRLSELTQEQQQQIADMVSREDYQKVLALVTGEEYMPGTPDDTDEPLYSGHFMNDVITFYSDEFPEPFSLEVSMNRLAEAEGLYTQYAFLTGNVFGEEINEYDSLFATTTVIQKNAFIESFTRSEALDLSTRNTYKGVFMLGEKPLSFSIDDTKGDFITRDHPNYTRYQSVGTAMITFDGNTFPVNALVEGTHAIDAGEYIFFSGYDEVEVYARQFVLWDESGNFYMIDHTEVTPYTPQYPSHSWLLYKDAVTGATKKSFTASVEDVITQAGTRTWLVKASELDDAQFELEETQTYAGELEGSMTSVLTGTVRDAKGTRAVSGILNLVQ